MSRSRIKTVVNDRITTRGPTTHGTADLRGQFPGTPELNGYDSQSALDIFQACLDGVQNDNVEFEMGVNMDYGDSPAVSTDVVAGTGDDWSYLSPYVPNPVVPPTGNPADFADWAGSSDWVAAQKVEQFPIGHGGTSSELDPSVSSAAISSVQIDEIPGSSGPTEV